MEFEEVDFNQLILDYKASIREKIFQLGQERPRGWNRTVNCLENALDNWIPDYFIRLFCIWKNTDGSFKDLGYMTTTITLACRENRMPNFSRKLIALEVVDFKKALEEKIENLEKIDNPRFDRPLRCLKEASESLRYNQIVYFLCQRNWEINRSINDLFNLCD